MTIPPELREWLLLVAKHRTFMGHSEEQVAVNILRKGLMDMIQGEYFTKLIEQQKLLKAKK